MGEGCTNARGGAHKVQYMYIICSDVRFFVQQYCSVTVGELMATPDPLTPPVQQIPAEVAAISTGENEQEEGQQEGNNTCAFYTCMIILF